MQRYAIQIVHTMDSFLASGEWQANDQFILLLPESAVQLVPEFKCIKIQLIRSGNLHLWEQVRLPLAARGSMLINLAGSAPLLKTAQVCTFHDTSVFDMPDSFTPAFGRWYRLLFKVQGKLSRRLLTVSAFSKARLSHHLAINPDKIGVVHCGADHISVQASDPDVLGRIGVTSRGFLLAVGSENPNKNFGRLIEAFAGLQDPGARLVVVGGRHPSVFASSVELACNDPRIIRTGRVTDAEIKALYSHARAYVFPSIYEGFGLPPIEAMFCNCPVLAAHAASIPEICGTAAAYFDPFSVQAIREVMARALHDDEWLDGLRSAGKERAKVFTWHKAAISLMNELRKLGVVQRRSTEA